MTNKIRLKYLAAAALSLLIGTYGLTAEAVPQESSAAQDISHIEVSDVETSFEASIITQSQPDDLSSSEEDISHEPVSEEVSEDDHVSVPEISEESSETVSEVHVSEPDDIETSKPGQGSLIIVTTSKTSQDDEFSEDYNYEPDEESFYEEQRDTDPLDISVDVDESTLTSEDWEKIKNGQVSVTINKDKTASPFADLKEDSGGGNDDWIFLFFGIAALTAGAAIIAAVIITTVISKKKRKKYKR